MEIRDRIVELKRVRAGKLRPNPKNWRTHPKKQQRAMTDMLQDIGYADALIARETPDGLELLDGHLRREVSPDEDVPVLIVDLDDREAERFLATFDPISAMAGADKELLSDLLDEIHTDSVAVNDMLADIAADAGIIDDLDVTEAPDAEPDLGAELQEKWGTESGQMWSVGQHVVLCGDSTSAEDVEKLTGGAKVDCVFTSPPYAVGIDYGDTYEDTIQNLRAMLPKLAQIWMDAVTPGGYAVVNFGDIVSGQAIAGTQGPCEYPMALEYWPAFREAGWVLWSRRIWCKPGAAVGSSRHCINSNRAASNFEHIWTWKTPGKSIICEQTKGQYASQNGWFDSTHGVNLGVGLKDHGAGMPIMPAIFGIRNHSHEGGLVLEPFCGTGTTLLACQQLKRICLGMEINPQYLAITLERCEKSGLAPSLEPQHG
jgi:DNA modification methylase